MPREMGSRETQRGASLGNNRETFLCEGKWIFTEIRFQRGQVGPSGGSGLLYPHVRQRDFGLYFVPNRSVKVWGDVIYAHDRRDVGFGVWLAQFSSMLEPACLSQSVICSLPPHAPGTACTEHVELMQASHWSPPCLRCLATYLLEHYFCYDLFRLTMN